jgi:hypothetical protein
MRGAGKSGVTYERRMAAAAGALAVSVWHLKSGLAKRKRNEGNRK